MQKKLKIIFSLGGLLIVSVMTIMFFQSKPMVKRLNNPRIASISVTIGKDGETYDCDVPIEGISDELNDALSSLFLHTEMRHTFFPPPQVYEISDDSVNITIKVWLDNSEDASMRVNLCTNPQYNSAQFGNTHYHILKHEKLYQDVYNMLVDVIPTYAVKR